MKRNEGYEGLPERYTGVVLTKFDTTFDAWLFLKTIDSFKKIWYTTDTITQTEFRMEVIHAWVSRNTISCILQNIWFPPKLKITAIAIKTI